MNRDALELYYFVRKAADANYAMSQNRELTDNEARIAKRVADALYEVCRQIEVE